MVDIDELAEALIGTCKSLSEVCPEHDKLTIEQLEHLDSLVMCCDQCGWWGYTDEMNTEHGEIMCIECCQENENEE